MLLLVFAGSIRGLICLKDCLGVHRLLVGLGALGLKNSTSQQGFGFRLDCHCIAFIGFATRP